MTSNAWKCAEKETHYENRVKTSILRNASRCLNFESGILVLDKIKLKAHVGKQIGKQGRGTKRLTNLYTSLESLWCHTTSDGSRSTYILYTIHHGEGALGARHVSPALEREAWRGPWICRSHLTNRPNKTYGPYTTRGPYTTCSDAIVSPFVSWREEADTGHGFGTYATIKVYVTINASTILAPYFQVGYFLVGAA